MLCRPSAISQTQRLALIDHVGLDGQLQQVNGGPDSSGMIANVAVHAASLAFRDGRCNEDCAPPMAGDRG